jgi:LPS export ABC transporter protein LptC
VVLLIFLAGCKNDLSKLPGADVQDIENDRAEDVKFIFSKNGKTEAVLYGKYFVKNDHAKPPYVDIKKDLKVDFYNDSLKIKSTLTANFGRLYPQTNNIIVRDSVVVVNDKGQKLETEELIWNQNIERFYTDKFVRITMDNQITYGEGLIANKDFTWFKIKKQRGTIPVDKKALPL